ncbi:hypothetical protein B4U45_13745 [Mycobacterium persicum]|uniref:Uncharacterized protein n=1 Tax=Mycobacterium persicum TaxID=1487726 RepID=A0A8E2IUI8_9MYCO|nr:hypothetical protein B4U45_13745 [Mycobacterium persicum]
MWLRALGTTFRHVADDAVVIEHRSKVSPTVCTTVRRPGFRQYVDPTIRGYSPSLTNPRLAAGFRARQGDDRVRPVAFSDSLAETMVSNWLMRQAASPGLRCRGG